MRSSIALAAVLVLGACAAPSAATPEASQRRTPQPTASRTEAPSPTVAPSATAAAPASWTSLNVDGGPAAREDHTWTPSPNGAVAFLFGGRDGSTVYGDLWAYDLATEAWQRLDPTGAPPARFGHEAAWVDGIGLVIFAGQAGSTFFNDLWAYDPDANAWRELPATGAVPAARYGTCAVVMDDGRLWISHGFTADGTRFADTVAYDFTSGTWTDETPAGDLPVVRCLHGCWMTDDGAFRLYAGQTTGVTALGDLWELREGAWTQLAGSLPPDRNLYARARDEGGTLVFGGQGLDGGYMGDLWRFADGSDGAEQVAVTGATPPARAGAELIRDEARDRLVLFGGRDADGALGDLWALSGVGG